MYNFFNTKNAPSLDTNIHSYLPSVTTLRFLVALAASLAVAAIIVRAIDAIVPKLAASLSARTDTMATTDSRLRLRRLETFLSIGAAAAKGLVFILALYVSYKVVNQTGQAPGAVAVVGAGTLFAVLAGSTLAPLLRDLSIGTVMIAEHWYNVGDHVELEPFKDVAGVVEQVTLRSTRLRSLKGEIIWIHNQHIQAVKVTPRSIRVINLDVFVTDEQRGLQLFTQVTRTLPKGPTMLAKQLEIIETEQLGGGLWRITAQGQTTPGREWLLESYAVQALQSADQALGEDTVIAYGPMVHYTDATAERRFKRAVRTRA